MRSFFLFATLALATAEAFPSCDPSCENCNLYCNQGCPAPLDLSLQSCGGCIYCRRESSACGFAEVDASNPVDPALCAQCEALCHCFIDAQCDDGKPLPTITPTPSAAPSGTTAA
ncbi:hypothetical protein GGR50DRAFT_662409 [Xylaria sp. CBS 124048]|nr:hypothetical protein GGR50DRAFT_662409 [Xylaria sp. CBS 124048]